MFHPEHDLRFAILEILREDGKSISAISRELEQRGFDLHRLILTGYLRALTDSGVLREKEVPPSKIYQPIKGKEKDIYETVSEAAHTIASDSEEADELTLYSLFRMFRRPIFQEELARAGIEGPSFGRTATKEERQEAKQILTKAGFKVPDSSKAYLMEESPELEKQFCDLMVFALISRQDVSYLVRETKQTKLL